VLGLAGPASLALLAAGLAVGTISFLDLGNFLPFWRRTLLLIFTIAVLWYAYNLVAIVELMVRKLTVRTGSALDEQLAPMVRKTLRIFLVVIGLLFIVESVFDQDIGAWLAGLGIAGLAVSLAAQDSLKNVFGSITILIDRPFRIGERIVYAGFDGVIEEIGFRSTKVRTLEGHLVTIPNSAIVNEPIQNIGRRPYLRRIMNVTITYDTPRAKIEEAVQILRGILAEPGIREPIHPKIGLDDYPPRVYFNDYNADSLNILVIYWYAPPAYWDYLEHAQRLNLRIFEEFERAGIEFAFPTQTLHLSGDPKRRLVMEILGTRGDEDRR
jgi:MscS family membrane protein